MYYLSMVCRKTYICWLVALAALFVCGKAQAQEAAKKTPIAIMDMDAKGVPASDASVVSDFLREEFLKTDKWEIIERGSMDKIMQEQKFQATGCTSMECAVELGKMLNVTKMVLGSLSKLGTKYYLTLRFVDVESSKVERAEKEEAGSLDEMSLVCKKLAQILSGTQAVKGAEAGPAGIKSAAETAPAIDNSGVSKSKNKAGTLWAASAAALAGTGVVFGVLSSKDSTNADAAYSDYQAAKSQEAAVKAINSADSLTKKADNKRIVSVVCYATAGVAAVMAIFKYTSANKANAKTASVPLKDNLALVFQPDLAKGSMYAGVKYDF